MKSAFRSHHAWLALALPLWLASSFPAAAQSPQLSSASPFPVGNGQIVTLRGADLFTSGNPAGTAVEFRQQNSTVPTLGSVIAEASSASTLYVRVPVPPASSSQPWATVRVRRGITIFSNTLPFQSTQGLAAPILLNAYRQSGDSCAGTPNSTPTSSIAPGQWLALAGDGLDLQSVSVTFTSQAGTFTAGAPCMALNPAIGIAALVPVPDSVGTSGSLQVRVSTGVPPSASPQSNTLTLQLSAPPPPPVIGSIQPNPAGLLQTVTINGSGLMVQGGSTPLVSFSQPATGGNGQGSVIMAASTPTRLFVVVPGPGSNIVPGSVNVAVANENGSGGSTLQISAVPASPSIRNIYGFTSPPNPNDLCSGSLNPVPLSQIAPGQAIAIAADGIGLSGNSVTFTSSAGTGQVGSPCSLANGVVGIAAAVVAPANLSGCSVSIALQAMQSPPSAPVSRAILSTSLSAVSLISSLNPSASGQSVTFTAQVVSQAGCAIPTGTVTFLDNGVPLGSAALNSGASAVLTTSSLSSGSHPITARYSGDALHALSNSPVLTQSVLTPPLNLSGACPGVVPVGVLLRIPLLPSGGTGNYQYGYSGPGWLSLKPASGMSGMVLEGTPPSVGTFPVTVTLSDSSSPSPVVFNCLIRVEAPLSMLGACPAPQAVPGVPYSVPVVVAGGSGQYQFFLNGPSWLAISASTGTAVNGSFQLTMSGIPPAAGSFPFSLQVRDVVGTTFLYSNCNIDVTTSALQITSGCPAPQLPIGSAYSFTLGASGAAPPYAWSIASGSLPAGLSLNGDVISGTPQGPSGTSAFTLRADSGALSGQLGCSITISQPPVQPLVLTAACPAKPVSPGSDVSWGYTAGGGTPPYQFQFVPPVQDWLTLSSSGTEAKIVGTAPQPGTYSVGVSVLDADGKTAAASCDLTVTTPPSCPPLELKTAAGCPASAVLTGVPYSLDASAAGGKAPYKWNLAGPAFLSLLETGPASARVSGTPPSAGASTYTVTLTDSCESPAATLSCNLTASAPPVPQISFTVGSITDPLQPVRTEVRLSQPSPVPLVADLILSFTPNAFGLTDNPRVQFLDPAATNAGRRLRVTFPAGVVSAQVPVQLDTVAGTVRIELAGMLSGELNLIAAPFPFTELTVPRLPPVITSLAIERDSPSGFDIVLAGYSTPRDMTTVTVAFTARPGKTIDEPSTITVQLADLFRTYYNSAASRTGGSTFTGLRLPVAIDGAQDAVASISVVLSNSSGSSKAEAKTR